MSHTSMNELDSMVKALAILDKKKQAIETAINETKAEILDNLKDLNEKSHTTRTWGKVVLVVNKTKEFGEAVKELEIQLKLAKQEAELRGDFTVTKTSEIVRFYAHQE